MDVKLRLSPDAEADLTHIRNTIITENPAAAERVQKSIARAIELIRYFPNLGRQGSIEGTREKPVKSLPYIIVYKIVASDIIILRIYYGAQKPGIINLSTAPRPLHLGGAPPSRYL